jgi:hypothetical protein
MTNTKPLHIHKWDSFLSVIFEDVALRIGDEVYDSSLGYGRVKEVVYGGKGLECLITFTDAGDQLRRREDLQLRANGWYSDKHGAGAGKRIKHDRELRELMQNVRRG